MASNFMGDIRPFDNGSWTGPWFCAGAIDPRIALSDPTNIKAHAMNGTYYNLLSLVPYTPPVYEDNTVFPNADATLAAVWADGIAINRPSNTTDSGSGDLPQQSAGPDIHSRQRHSGRRI